MNQDEKCLKYYYGEYRRTIISKKQLMKLYVYPNYIEGTGFLFYDGEMSKGVSTFKVTFDELKDILLTDLKDNRGINIIFKPKDTIVSENESSILLLGIPQQEEALHLIEEARNKYKGKIRAELEDEEQKEEGRLRRIKEEEASAIQFFQDCYNFHITINDNPYFELLEDNLQVALIYIDKDRNLNFLRIDGSNHDESNGVIPYSQIHYFEKVGMIHYATDINGTYSSFGGSITSSTFSKKTAFWAGLLLGPMGMAGGALFSHKPSRVEMPTTQFNIESNVMRIDERNVILNYYSGTHKQYIDIELPADSYNFLQTYLPDKKYDIVMELEKKSAVDKEVKEIENGTVRDGISSKSEFNEFDTKQRKDDMVSFQHKIDKLKLMYDAGMLSDVEYDFEKKKILELL